MRELLTGINKTELIQMARTAGLGNLGSDLSEEDLIWALEHGTTPESVAKHVRDDETPACPLEGPRQRVEAHIEKNKQWLRSQLPGCTGKCTSFGCPDIIVVRCWEGFRNDIL